VAAMLLSAISACACAHHLPNLKTTENCHSNQHSKEHAGKRSAQHGEHGNAARSHGNADDGQGSATNDNDLNSFEIPCNCGEGNSVTAVTVRNESARQTAAAANEIEIDLVPTEFTVELQGTNNFLSTQNSYHTFFRYRSGPSRAPPRL
jgi:hypothetical protein